MKRLITSFSIAAVLVWAGLAGSVSAASFPGDPHPGSDIC